MLSHILVSEKNVFKVGSKCRIFPVDVSQQNLKKELQKKGKSLQTSPKQQQGETKCKKKLCACAWVRRIAFRNIQGMTAHLHLPFYFNADWGKEGRACGEIMANCGNLQEILWISTPRPTPWHSAWWRMRLWCVQQRTHRAPSWTHPRSCLHNRSGAKLTQWQTMLCPNARCVNWRTDPFWTTWPLGMNDCIGGSWQRDAAENSYY